MGGGKDCWPQAEWCRGELLVAEAVVNSGMAPRVLYTPSLAIELISVNIIPFI